MKDVPFKINLFPRNYYTINNKYEINQNFISNQFAAPDPVNPQHPSSTADAKKTDQ